MKKVLLMAALMAGSVVANAQVTKLNVKNMVKEPVTYVRNAKVAENVTRADEVVEPNVFYYRPQGVFFSGMDNNGAFITPQIAFCPANVDITFTSFHKDGVQPTWSFPSPDLELGEDGNVLMKGQNSEELTLKFSKEGDAFLPILHNQADKKNDFYQPALKLHVGGQTYAYETEVEIPGQGKQNMSTFAYASNTHIDFASELQASNGIFATKDADSDATAQGVFGDPKWKTMGFGEAFVPTANMAVKSFNATIYTGLPLNDKDFGKITAKILVPNAKGVLEEVNVNLKGSYKEVSNNVYFLNYEIQGEPIVIKAGTPMFTAISSSRVQMGLLFVTSNHFDEKMMEKGIVTSYVDAMTSKGRTFYPTAGVGIPADPKKGTPAWFINSWCMGIEMSYAANGFAGIENVEVAEQKADNNVYTMAGVKVANNGNLENLPAGIYVMNGKKYIVK